MVSVLVAGAEGALGARVLALLGADEQIDLVPAGGRVETADEVGDGGVDVIVHLGSGDHDRLARRRQNITEGIDRTLAEAINRDAGHLVLVSSAMVYGAWPNNPVPLTEEAILRPDVEFVYARQLAAAEAMVDRWRRVRPGRTVTVLRPVVTMAADGTSQLAASLAAGLGRSFAEDDPPAQFLHLDDLASAVALGVRAAARRRLQRRPRRLDRRRAGARALRSAAARAAPRATGRGVGGAALALPTRTDPARPA